MGIHAVDGLGQFDDSAAIALEETGTARERSEHGGWPGSVSTGQEDYEDQYVEPPIGTFVRLIEPIIGGLILADGVWITVVTLDRDTGMDRVVGLASGLILAVAAGTWLLWMVWRR